MELGEEDFKPLEMTGNPARHFLIIDFVKGCRRDDWGRIKWRAAPLSIDALGALKKDWDLLIFERGN